MSRAGIPVFAAAAAWTLASCGGSPVDVNSGVEVEVRRGPIEPVETEGMDNTAPVAGARVILERRGSVVGRSETDSRGLATLPAAPGDYTVVVSLCPGALGLPGPEAVRVAEGGVERVRMECDTGIR